MKPARKLLLALSLLPVCPRSSRAQAAALGKGRLQALLQRFVDQVHKQGFLKLGDESDFDHGHLLRDSAGRPLALLYHTQELETDGRMDPKARNWLQSLDDGRVEDAAKLKRSRYPSGAGWDLFRQDELPGLEGRHTVVDKMIDPAKLAVDPSRTEQWTFSRTGCGAASSESEGLRVRLEGALVCLALKRG